MLLDQFLHLVVGHSHVGEHLVHVVVSAAAQQAGQVLLIQLEHMLQKTEAEVKDGVVTIQSGLAVKLWLVLANLAPQIFAVISLW